MTPARVLLVDDDPNILEGLRDILEDAGIPVVTASTAAEAQSCAQAQPPRLVIVDFQLPDATGLELARRLREQLPHAVLWLMTGMSAHELGGVSAHLVNDVLTKPVDPAHLLARLQKVLNSL